LTCRPLASTLATVEIPPRRRGPWRAQGPGQARHLVPNAFGVPDALVGLAAGFVLASVLVSAVAALSGHPGRTSGVGSDVASLLGLWTGLVGAAVVASRRAARPGGEAPTAPRPRRAGAGAGERAASRTGARAGVVTLLRDDYGWTVRLWPDVPVGIAVGLVSQYALVPLFELPLLPFVPHLFTRLGAPAVSLTSGAHGAGLVLLGVLVCLGSPVVEELYFRGLLLRGLAGRLAGLGGRLGPVLSVVVVGIVFGLVHFEALQLLALVGFGVVLGALAWRTGRLGPGTVAHIAFNTAAFVSVARAH
jgi:membrane protease YdiL (CAAX protease family)